MEKLQNYNQLLNIQNGQGANDIILKFHPTKYKLDAKYSNTNKNFSKKYPVTEFAEYIKESRNIKDFLYYNLITNPIMSQSKELQSKYKDLAKTNRYLAYDFQSYLSIIFFEIINKFTLLDKDAKVLLVDKNGYALDTILYYQKYANYNFDQDNIFLCLESDNTFAIDFAKYHHIKYYTLTNPLNNDTIKHLNKIIPYKTDFIFINFNILIKELDFIRNNYALQTISAIIIVALNNLNSKGNMLMFIPRITNKLTFNFYHYLSNFFEESFIFESEILTVDKLFMPLIYKNYKGNFKESELLDINNKLFECDTTGGFNYQIENKAESSLFEISYQSPHPPKCYVNNIIKMESSNDFIEYCKMTKNIWLNQLKNLVEIINLSQNPSKIPQKIIENAAYGIKYVKNINLKTTEWVTDKGLDTIFGDTVINILKHDMKPYCEQFKHTCDNITIKLSDNIEYYNETHMQNIWKMSEDVYQYIEKVDQNTRKQPELFFNNKQKTLQKFLQDKYKITINNKYVSRAWAKMYELLYSTKYFDNLKSNTVTALHICEAPGNFIASTLHYTQNNTQIKHYDWKAQSWKGGDIWDEYGFIKQNSQKWDFGKDNTGNIMNYDNLKYYYDKYKGVDSVVGDCGEPWTSKKEGVKDLGVYQLLYSLMIPKIGGNFIMKTFAINYNALFMSLLVVAICKYDKLFIFRSGINVWSPEIYIVGIGKKQINQDEINNLFTIAKKLENNQVIYPVSELRAEFMTEFEFHTQNIVQIFSNVKKFFVYLARNPVEFDKLKPKLEKLLDDINIKWLTKYMPFLTDSKEKYLKYISTGESPVII